MKRRIVLLGPPASGKGTLADALQTRLGVPVASPGAMLRAEKAAGTPLGIEADRLTRGGNLVGDSIINEVVQSWLSGDRASGFIFDGYPRTLGQATELDRMLADRNSSLDVAILLDAAVDTLRRRVQSRATCSQCGNIVSVGVHVPDHSAQCPRCGGALARRADDTVETLEFRLQEYASKTAPVAGYYEKRGVLHRISTERPEQDVLQSALQILN